MARIDPVKITTSTALAVADIGLEYMDDKQGWTNPFQNSKDVMRTAGFVGGLVGLIMGRDGDTITKVAETALYTTETGFFRTVKDAAHTYLKLGARKNLKSTSELGLTMKERGQIPLQRSRTRYV